MEYTVIGLIFLGILSYFLNKGEIIAPSFIFSMSFIYSGIWAWSYKNKWLTKLSINTCMVILLGVFIYIVFTFITRRYYEVHNHNRKNFGVAPRSIIYIEKWKEYVYLFVSAVIVFLYVKAIKNTTGINELSSAITVYKQAALAGNSPYGLPGWINYARNMISAGGYWFAYLIARDVFVAKKTSLTRILIFLLSMYSFSLSGGRSGAITQVLAVICIYAVFTMQEKKSVFFVPFRYFILGIIIFILGIVFFQQLGFLLGRTVQHNNLDYIAMYSGSQFHDLNELIVKRYGMIDRSIFGSQTFRNVIATVLATKGKGYYYYDLPYIFSNGYFLGNVGTTFYATLYDFGYIGCMIMTAIMATFSQILYEKVKRNNNDGNISLSLVFFGYIFNTFVFAFFSDWFYENTVSIVFIQYLFWWWIFKFFFCTKYKVS